MGKNEIEGTGANPVWPLREKNTLPAAWTAPAAGAATAESEGSKTLDLSNLLRIASEWRWVILASLAVGTALAVIATLLATPLYRSTAVLEMSPPAVEVLEKGKGGSPVVTADREFLATQYGLLQSRSLAERVAQDLNLASNETFVPADADRQTRQRVAANRVMSNFEVKPVPNSRLVQISYSSEDPVLAARVTNSYADNFINSNLERRYEASSYARDFLQRQIARLKGELESTERRLVAYAQQQGLISTQSSAEGAQEGGSGSLTGASLAALNAALAEAETRRIAAEQRYRTVANASSAEVNERVSPLRTQKAALEAEYQEKLNTFRPDYPDMVRLKTRIDALEQTINREASGVARSRSSTLLAEFRAAAAEEQKLRARVSALKGAVLDERGRSIQYNILQRELDTNRSLYDALLQRYREIGIAGGVGTNNVSVVDGAEVPGAPYSPNLPLNLLIGSGLGFAFGFLGAIGLDFMNDVIKTPDDVREKLGLAPLGSIPKKKGVRAVLEEIADRTSPVAEAYFSLSSTLQFTTDTGLPKTLLITSTRAAEGKSSTTVALAHSFARLGKRVLLVDADLRKPAFVTGLEKKNGLSRLLTNSEALTDHVMETGVDNLSLLPSGPIPPNPAELLSSLRLFGLLSEAAELYDIVVVDGPPVLGLADAPLLSNACRATLLVVESGKTRSKAARDAVERLVRAGAHIVGGVLTKYRSPAGYGYGYGYGQDYYQYSGVGSREREINLITKRDS